MIKRIICLTIILVACPVFADIIHKHKGGKMEGDLTQVKISTDGRVVVLEGDNIASVELGDDGNDVVTQKDGTTIEGQVESVAIQTVGGEFTFARNKISLVDLSLSPQEQLRAEYRKRSDALKLEDADGHHDLALWCQENGLGDEMRGELRACLAAAPEDDRAPQWHQMLGHVFHDGQWMTREEKKEAVRAEMEAKGMVEYNGEWIPREEYEKLTATAESIKTKFAAALEQVETRYKTELEEMEKQYDDDLNALKLEHSQLKSRIEQLTQAIKDEKRAEKQNKKDNVEDRNRPKRIREINRLKSEATKELKLIAKKKAALSKSTKKQASKLKSKHRKRVSTLNNLEIEFKQKARKQGVSDEQIDAAIAKAIGD